MLKYQLTHVTQVKLEYFSFHINLFQIHFHSHSIHSYIAILTIISYTSNIIIAIQRYQHIDINVDAGTSLIDHQQQH